MSTICSAPVRGRVIRVTRLDAAGNPDPGQSAVVVSKRISSVALSENTEEGNDIRERNFDDELCVVDNGKTVLVGYNGEITLCGVDPDLVSLLTGQPVTKNAAGDVVGIDITQSVDLDEDVNYALEIWSRLAGNPTDGNGNRLWGYFLVPFFKGGVMNGFTIENGAITFTIAGAKTEVGNGWGVGPYDVDRDGSGIPAPLHEPIPEDAHFRFTQVSLAPPQATCGAQALASV